MRIHEAIFPDRSQWSNPFSWQLVQALEDEPRVSSVGHGLRALSSDLEADVVHLHWPEALTDWREPSSGELASVIGLLDALRSNTRIVATVHNLHPHYRDTPRFEALYRAVYERAHGLVHLGEASKPMLRRRFGDLEAIQSVIPHGNYQGFPNHISAAEARALLGLAPEGPVALSLGVYRHPEEIEMLLHGFNGSVMREGRLVIAGQVRFRRPTHRLRDLAIRWRARRLPGVIMWRSRIPNDRIQRFLNAADVLVIPRRHALNSGSVALGFTFGKVVVGPDLGVIGEVLSETGNPVFDPHDTGTLSRALGDAWSASRSGQGQRNLEYSRSTMDWDVIARQHVDFFGKLLAD